MYSFDVFDTLITRSTATPKGIFMLMQKAIQEQKEYSSFISRNFYELRVGAEELARMNAVSTGKAEVTLDDIYRAFGATSSVSETQLEKLKQLEIETEYNNVLEIVENIVLLKKLQNQGEHIVLISDMYLGETNIHSMLCKIDSLFEEIPLYVSSSYNKTKGSGELFKVVKTKENVDFSDWIHYGDNEYADIEAASKLGIKTVRIVPDGLKEYEQPQKDVWHQLSVGISRYVRGTIGEENIAHEVGCSLAGPILYRYIKWVLDESMKKGINRLYFVARDGWILQQIADIIIQVENYSIKTYYIYGSRKAWRLPAFGGSKEEFINLIKYSNMDEVLCLDDLAEVFHIETEMLIRFLPKEYKRMSVEEKFVYFQKDNICKQLYESDLFRNYLVESQNKNRELVIRYLQQELDFSDENYAFVELSGTGLTQEWLAKLIGTFHSGKVRNFYFKMDNIHDEAQCCFLNFCPSNIERSYMVELLCRAPHGQTEGYRREENKIVPILEQKEGVQFQDYDIETYRDAVLAYVWQMEQILVQNNISYIAELEIAKEYICVIAKQPPERIANYFCYMPFSAGGRKNSKIVFAPQISNRQLRAIYFWNNGNKIKQIYEGSDLSYALTVSDNARKYKEKCLKYRKNIIGKLLINLKNWIFLCQKSETSRLCPWEFLKGDIVIYGAGKIGQAYVKQARQKHAKCNSLLWVDSNYANLQVSNIDVKSPEEIKKHSFDRIIIAIHNVKARQEVWDKLRKMGIEAEKIYYG